MNIEKSLKKQKVNTLEYPTPPPMPDTTPVGEVIEAMLSNRVGCILLTRDEKLSGIFTERDVLNEILGDDAKLGQPVAKFMTSNPITVSGDEGISKAIFHMHQGGFRNVPVVDDEGRPKGYVHHRAIIRYMVAHFAGHVLNLPPEQDQLSVAREGG
ncbi:CBS domain-containing protein [bacterium AH-315-M10]|nr:CBS domain-containing protein [bacterium AH-315-M10]